MWKALVLFWNYYSCFNSFTEWNIINRIITWYYEYVKRTATPSGDFSYAGKKVLMINGEHPAILSVYIIQINPFLYG